MKRLEKNRESARECRKRKKQHKEKLEEQLAVLDVSLPSAPACTVASASLCVTFFTTCNGGFLPVLRTVSFKNSYCEQSARGSES